MKIPVLGMDPSLRNWGLASAELDLITGELSTPSLSLVQPKDLEGKQVRQNSSDLHLAEQLSSGVFPLAQSAKVIFVECPTGSQSARAMASYGVCIGILGALRVTGVPLIEVTATESKLVLTGLREANKRQMIDAAHKCYPEANWFIKKGKLLDKCEHVADAIAAIHAGVRTSSFKNLMRLFQTIKENP